MTYTLCKVLKMKLYEILFVLPLCFPIFQPLKKLNTNIVFNSLVGGGKWKQMKADLCSDLASLCPFGIFVFFYINRLTHFKMSESVIYHNCRQHGGYVCRGE